MVNVAILGDGLLGMTLADALPSATVLRHADIEVTNRESVKRALDGYDVAINTVALHKLPACENDPMLARLVNADGARYVAEAVPTVYVSTDYVFNDGGPHDESLPGQEPRSAYGRSKLGGEMATLEHGGIVVRVAGLYGRYRSHKGPSFPDAVTTGFDKMRLPNDQRFSPTYADDAAERIARLAREFAAWHHESERPEGIYHAANAGSTTWHEFAENILEVTRHPRKVEGYHARDAIRPTNSVLRSTRLPPLRHWRLALEEWATWRTVELRDKRVSPLRPEVPWTPAR